MIVDENGMCTLNEEDYSYHSNGREKRKTNADRIRAMSDEELAEFLWDVWKHKDPFYKECVDGWLVPFCHWLKQGASE